MLRVATCWILVTAAMSCAAPRSDIPSSAALTVLLDFERPHSPASLRALDRELGRILAPAGFKIDLRDKTDLLPRSEFHGLVLFKMKGRCSMETLPIGALSDERGALAMTYSVDGEMLNFGEVECDRVRTSVQRVLGRSDPAAKQSAYGKALARVMAHEIYHMLAQSSAHTRLGVTKESLSGRELSQDYLPLDGSARAAVRGSASR